MKGDSLTTVNQYQSNTDHSDGNLGQFVVSTTEPKTTAGSVTMSHSWTGDDDWAHSLFVIKPVIAPVGSTSDFFLMF